MGESESTKSYREDLRWRSVVEKGAEQKYEAVLKTCMFL